MKGLDKVIEEMRVRYSLLISEEDLSIKPDWSKVSGTPGPGARVTIIWDSNSGADYDEGYLIELPDLPNIFLVHIPNPTPIDNDSEFTSPEWILLEALTAAQNIDRILISEL